jgi:uncharacterized membrane protein
MHPRALSLELRQSRHPILKNRRRIAGLSLTSGASMMLIGLYQLGILRHLPDLPGRWFDAERVDASSEAYARFATPDAFLGLVSYGLTAMLAAAGGVRRSRWIARALFAKVLGDSAFALKLTIDQWAKHRAFCVWCLIAAAATFASLPLSTRELRD